MLPTPHLDQLEAACHEVKLYVGRLAENPPCGTAVTQGDQAVNDAIWYRLKGDLADGTIRACCERTRSPRPMYWLPRQNVMLCDEHWNTGNHCMCFEECRAPIGEAVCVFMFMHLYIVQAMLCLDCEERVRLSPTGG
jgi:hypothetical protein